MDSSIVKFYRTMEADWGWWWWWTKPPTGPVNRDVPMFRTSKVDPWSKKSKQEEQGGLEGFGPWDARLGFRVRVRVRVRIPSRQVVFLSSGRRSH